MVKGNTAAKTRLASVSNPRSIRSSSRRFRLRRNAALVATTIHDAATKGFVSGARSAGTAQRATSAGACIAARQWNVSA